MKLWFLTINCKTKNIVEAFNIPFIVCGTKWDMFAQDDAENDIKTLKSFCWCLCNEYLIANVWTNENTFRIKRREEKEKWKEENDAILIFFIWCITFKAVT